MTMAAPTLTRTITPDADAPGVLDGTRRRVDVVRSLTGRVATVAGTAAAAAVLIHPGLALEAVVATGAATLAGAGILRLSAPMAGHQKATATVLYTVPGAGLAALLGAEYLVDGLAWGGTVPMEVLAVAVWAGGTWLARPARVARRMLTPRPPAAPATTVAPAAADDRHPAARWWDDRVAAGGGPAVGTVLEAIELTGERSMTAIIRAAENGKPVPDISIRHLSALLDLPEEQISVAPVPGRGAGVRRLRVGKAAAAQDDPAMVWAERIAPMAMPGAVLTSVRVGKPGTPDTPAGSTDAPPVDTAALIDALTDDTPTDAETDETTREDA
jgi:hypothetical protein